jgi:tetratricopeptide (TPR) repeat protein
VNRVLNACIFFFWFVSAFAQNPDAASAAFQAHNWTKAAAEYQKIASADPQNGEAWYQLGFSLYSMDRFPEAADAFRHAAELKFRPVFSTYNSAASLARSGQTDNALAWLEKLPGMGYRNVQQIEQDQDFTLLKESRRFQGVLVALRRNAAPCEETELNRQFDFWVGEWDVQTVRGQHAGSSSVQKILGGCVILENWTGLGSQGKSFNAYNQGLKKWQQYWVDDSGTTTLYTGEIVGNQMSYIADAGSQNGQQARKMTFTRLPDGKVRQLGETSTDGGKTWTVAYDLIYVPKN